jgi:hypothetical protein
VSNVEPSRADFLAVDIPDGVIHEMELEQNEKEWELRKVLPLRDDDCTNNLPHSPRIQSSKKHGESVAFPRGVYGRNR